MGKHAWMYIETGLTKKKGLLKGSLPPPSAHYL